MRKAVIDLGTNTFHLIVADISGSSINVIYKSQVVVKLGEGGINRGEISAPAFRRGILALKEFSRDLKRLDPQETTAIATSAIRSAENGNAFVEEAFRETGIRISVIGGDLEAELIFKGVLSSFPESIDAPFLVMDIGGGSVEFIIGHKKNILWKRSFEIGCARLVELFHRQDPISAEEIKALESFLKEQLQPLSAQALVSPFKTLIGSAGSFESIAEIICPDGDMDEKRTYSEIPLADYLTLHRKLLASSTADRIKMPGLADYRIEMIVVASILIFFIVSTFGISRLVCSRHSLKEGILLRNQGI